MAKENLKNLIEQKSARVAVVGLGYVGLPTAIAIARGGFSVVGIDVNRQRVDQLNGGKSFIKEIPSAAIKEILPRFRASSDWPEIAKCQIILIAVPTPLTKNKTPDTSFIEKAAASIAQYLQPDSLVILESTTYPGTTEELLKPLLPLCYLVFAPERIDPGNKDHRFEDVPKVVGGVDEESTELAAVFYGKFLKNIHKVSSPKAAEMTKLLENIFRLVNISMINELKMLADKMNIDFWEVIEAAKTKPYGFMPFYPGPGCGGHCFGEEQQLLIIDNGKIKLMGVKEIYDHIHDSEKVLMDINQDCLTENSSVAVAVHRPVILATTDNPLTTVTINPINHQPSQETIGHVSRRISDHILHLKCGYNYELKVTDQHPLFTLDEQTNSLKIKFAGDIAVRDFLPLPKNLPSSSLPVNFDLIEIVAKHAPHLIPKFRIRLQKDRWENYRSYLDYFLKGHKNKRDFLRGNYLPLKEFLLIEKYLPVQRTDLLIASGQGPSLNQMPAIINIDKEWARLIGYYLSEGCLTADEKTLRLRFTFHSDETEYINDLCQILRDKGIKFSTYKDKQWQSYHIKVSSKILGILFRDVLKIGTNCYEMAIPSPLFFSTSIIRREILAGILRGDGGVYLPPPRHQYNKNGRSYNHKNNSVEISYFTSSSVLFEQVQLILHENGIVPSLKKRKGLLIINGANNAGKLSKLFGGKKEKIIEKYLSLISKQPNYNLRKENHDYLFIKVREIKKINESRAVYSLEVNNTNTLLTNGGILVHNCIPLDPFYLSWKARELNFFTRFIDLAGEINELMPHYVVTRINWALNQRQKSINGSKILVLGVAYKKDIDDARESPALAVIEDLLRKKARVIYNDPHIPEIKTDGQTLHATPLTSEVLNQQDCVVILTDHSAYDYPLIVREAPLIVDFRGAIKQKNEKVVK